MAKKKDINKEELIELYIEHINSQSKRPNSVYIFMSDNKYSESDFYNYFGSFEALEQSIFKIFSEKTLNVLLKSKDYPDFNNRNKLLSYYFTLFGNFTANRSFILQIINNQKNKLNRLTIFKELKKSFYEYLDTLEINTFDFKEEKISKLQLKAIKESAWNQLLLTINFWMEDTSKGFEKTDIFIEKSINASFDLMDIKPVESLIDFGKFLFKEKFQIN